MSYTAAVVGAGPNGLSAAIRLAQAGHKVVVYERASVAGGGLRTEALTRPGFLHDTCSSVHPMGISSPFWNTLPLEQHGLTWTHPELPVAHPLDEAPAVLLHRSVEDTAAGLDPQDRASYTRLFGWLSRRWPDLARDAMGPLSIPADPILLARFGLHAFQPAATFATRTFKGERARALFAGCAGHSVLPLHRTPSAAIGLMLQAAAHGAGWPMPQGGAGALADALVSVLRSLGGVIKTGTFIDALDQIETDGPVLFDTGPRALASMAPHLGGAWKRQVDAFRYGAGACKVDWALDGPIPWADPAVGRAGTVHLGGSLDAIAKAEAAPYEGQHSEDPYVLVVQHSVADPTRAPEGKQVAWGYCHVPSGSTEDRTEAVEAQVERFAPGFRDRILERHTKTAAALEAWNPNYIGGDVNGGAADWDQLFARPVRSLRPYATPDRRLFLCSASTPPGGGVHGMCGLFAADLALKRHPAPAGR